MKRLFLILCLFLFQFQLGAQELLKTGYASLIVKFHGDFPETPPLSVMNYSSLFSSDAPENWCKVNDSTFIFTHFSYGPLRFHFMFNNQYLTGNLVPNIVSELNINYSQGAEYTMDFSGPFKEIFASSDSIFKAIKYGLLYNYRKNLVKKDNNESYKEANTYRDDLSEAIRLRIEEAESGLSGKSVKDFFHYNLVGHLTASYLINDYNSNLFKFNISIGMDSLAASRNVPHRDASYYNTLLNDIDVDNVGYFNHDFLKAILRDTIVGLPDIYSVSLNKFKEALALKFSAIIKQDQELLYDILITTAYLEQIDQGKSLSSFQQYDILQYFFNKELANYIFFQNENSRSELKSPMESGLYFPFSAKKNEVLGDILGKYQGKVVVLDFWATWCGPCLKGFDEMKEVRDRYKDNNDVVFVYLTDESSNPEIWNKYVKLLGGEHYYLYSNQSKKINAKLGIKSIPSYFIYDRKGNLSFSRLGFVGDYGEIKTAIQRETAH